MVETTTQYYYMAYADLSFVPDRHAQEVNTADSRGLGRRPILPANCIDPSRPFRFTFRKSKKMYFRCICEPICTIYYAAAHRHSFHEPFSLAVKLVRNIRRPRVFANHRNKQTKG